MISQRVLEAKTVAGVHPSSVNKGRTPWPLAERDHHSLIRTFASALAHRLITIPTAHCQSGLTRPRSFATARSAEDSFELELTFKLTGGPPLRIQMAR